MSNLRERAGRPGDVVRLPELGHIRPKPGHDLVCVFLGACRLEDEPDAAAYLQGIGFTRSHAFEVTLHWMNGPQLTHSSRHVFLADTPREALESAVRFAGAMRETETVCDLAGMSLCLMRLGRIGPDGRPNNGRGQAFARWSADSGRSLESLLQS